MRKLATLLGIWILSATTAYGQSVFQCQIETSSEKWAPQTVAFFMPRKSGPGLVFDDVTQRISGEPQSVTIQRSGANARFQWGSRGGKTRRVTGARSIEYSAAFTGANRKLTLNVARTGQSPAPLTGVCRPAPRDQVRAMETLLKQPELRITGGASAKSNGTLDCRLKVARSGRDLLPTDVKLGLVNNVIKVDSETYNDWGLDTQQAKISSRRGNDLIFGWKIKSLPRDVTQRIDRSAGVKTLTMNGRLSLATGKLSLRGDFLSGRRVVLDSGTLRSSGSCKVNK